MRKYKGFTLAELLIVVGIIAVLVAVSIPIFSNQLEKSRRAVDGATARQLLSVVVNAYNSGDIEFTSDNQIFMVYVSQDRGAVYVSGDVRVKGKTWRDDATSYARGYDLMAESGISVSDLRVKAQVVKEGTTESDGWIHYAVILQGDGQYAIVSSPNAYTVTNGNFENWARNFMKTGANKGNLNQWIGTGNGSGK